MTSAFASGAVGLTVGLALPARPGQATLAAATAPAATAPAYLLLTCSDQGQTEPSSFIMTCADAGMRLEGLRWTTWSSHFASAYGTFSENDCEPNCASGHVRDYPVVVTAWGSKGVPGHSSERAYTELTLTFPASSRPPVQALAGGKAEVTYPVTQVLPAA
ncbi:MAG TPA: hypothetical protein VMG38_14550 [Trebonia sp.]|nr:hypothetical protein [Trebonia sp.]